MSEDKGRPVLPHRSGGIRLPAPPDSGHMQIAMRVAGTTDCAYHIVQSSTLENMLAQANASYDKHGPGSLVGPVIADLEIILAGQAVTLRDDT